jgi:FtsH-binding integral membrane protein
MNYSENNVYDVSSRTQADVQTFVSRVFAVMGFGLLLTGVVAFMTLNIPALLSIAYKGVWLLFVAQLALVFYLSAKATKLPAQTALMWFLIYSVLSGLTLSILLNMYTHASIASAFLVSGGMFGGMAMWGLSSKKDLTSVGSLCFMGLIGLILATFVNYFIQSSAMDLFISYGIVAVFIGLTAWDAQMIKKMGSSPQAPGLVVWGALKLYLDFINMFIYILRIIGTRRD